MKTKLSLLTIFLFASLPFIQAQAVETIQPPTTDKARVFANNKKSPVQSLSGALAIDPEAVAAQPKWDVTLSQYGVNHASETPKNVIDSIKQAGEALKKREGSSLDEIIREEISPVGGSAVTPQIKASFKGNKFNFGTPPDNSIAVSDEGYVVSVVNRSLLFTDETGAVLLEETFENYLSFLNLTGLYFDPKVIYDPDEDKFIMVALNGNTPATSKVVIGFSTSSNPMDNWWFYTFSGDPTGANLWLDYPSIGISTDDLYISGNQFTTNYVFSQALIYQLNKKPGFTGGFVDGLHWYGIQDAFGANDFTVVPLSHGFNGTYGPGIYFISTNSAGGADAMMYYTDNNSQNNPNLFVYQVDIPNYYVPFNAQMLGTTDKLETNDCRTQSGFYADGTIHFAFNNRGDDLHAKVNYCRVNVNDLTSQTLVIGQQPYECAFPAVAPFTNSPADKTVLVAYLRAHSTIYPEFRMVVVDNDMNVSSSVLVKEGTSYENVEASAEERWGDYTGISRRHSAERAEVWIAGNYGEANDNGNLNVMDTWIAQITDGQTAQPPLADFNASQTTVTAGQPVTFTDQSTNAPTSWTWSFPGGLPTVSELQNPVVVYPAAGCFDVTLIATNAAGANAVTKPCYVHVQTTSTEEQEAIFSNFVVFPNPVTEGRLNIAFEIDQPTALEFFVVSNGGTVVRELLHRRVKAGLNTLAFSTHPLSAGTYYLVVLDEHGAVLKNQTFIVVN